MIEGVEQPDLVVEPTHPHALRASYLSAIGFFLSAFNSGFFCFALMPISRNFTAKLTFVSWSLTFYFLLIAVSIGVFFQISKHVGTLRVFRWGVVLFFIGCVFSVFSHGWIQLIAARSLQALGAGAMQATVVNLLVDYVDLKKCRTSMVRSGMSFCIGVFLGFFVAGFLMQWTSWRFMFVVMAVMSFGTYVLSLTIKNKVRQHHLGRPDFIGMLIFLLAAVAFILGLSRASYAVPNYHLVRSFFIIAIILFFVFIFYESNKRNGFIHLGLFHNIRFSALIVATVVHCMVTISIFILPAICLFELRGSLDWKAALICGLPALGITLTSPISRRVVNHEYYRYFVLVGSIICLLSVLYLRLIPSQVQDLTLAVGLFTYGLGSGLVQPALVRSMVYATEESHPIEMMKFSRMFSNLGNGLGVAIIVFYIEKYFENKIKNVFSGINHALDFSMVMISIALLFVLIDTLVIYIRRRREP